MNLDCFGLDVLEAPTYRRESIRMHIAALQAQGGLSASFTLESSRGENEMKIRIDDLNGVEVQDLLREHMHNMHELSPPESVHALDLSRLRSPDVTFWSAWNADELLGCGALKELDPHHGEIKSMRTVTTHRRKGVASAMLTHMLQEAERRCYLRLSLETGSQVGFAPARALYKLFGFKECGPFGEYRADPNSVFMTRSLV